MSELLDAAIEEIGRVLIGNKDRNTEEVYLKNAIRHIREYGSQPQLNENQQEMLQEVIKQYDITKPKTVLHALEHLSMIAFLLDEMEEVTEEDCIVVAQAFLDWAQELGEE